MIRKNAFQYVCPADCSARRHKYMKFPSKRCQTQTKVHLVVPALLRCRPWMSFCHIIFYLCGFGSFGCLFQLFSRHSVLRHFFICVFRSLRYVPVSGAIEKVGTRECKVFRVNTTRRMRRGDCVQNRKPGLAACPFYPVTLQKSKCEALRYCL